MPQLDQITWFSQICWLVLIFLVMYVYILKDFAPALYKSKKIREKIEVQKVAFITTQLDLTTAEAQVFWPVNNQFSEEM
jgi:hypothetical protein